MSKNVKKQEQNKPRVVIVNGTQLTVFPSNMISTQKYTVLTFVPLFLFSQLRNYTNCFFLAIIIIQQVPGVSPIGRYTTLVPFIIIMTISAIKEIIEDYKRFLNNKTINLKEVDVLKNSEWVKIKWKDVSVGDVVRVTDDSFFPADLILVATSNPEGLCYIETVNLDGENNLKIRRGIPQLLRLNTPEELMKFTAVVTCDPPNALIYNFNGHIKIDRDDIALESNQLLLRGAVLKNTNWVVGAVVYTGHDTKIMRNSSTTPLKLSSIISISNKQMLILAGMCVLIIIANAVFSYLWTARALEFCWYLDIDEEDLSAASVLYSFLTFVILYSFMIPISLQVCQEIARYFQAIFINSDMEMFYEQNSVGAAARTSSLNEDLGLVRYIFTDKTGTLTQNILEFKCCIIDGVTYDVSKFAELATGNKIGNMHNFFVCICLCNTVVPAIDPKTGEKMYFASSPDERALIMASSKFGYVLDSRTRYTVRVTVDKRLIEYQILATFEFSSNRRRSSVIVKDPNGKICLYIMGSDDVIYKRLSKMSRSVDVTFRGVEHFSLSGLRTLCIGMAELNLNFFEQWYPSYKQAEGALLNKAKKMEKVAEEVEKDILLLGATAVEDKLQDEVPETISLLMQAGINIWMLTGDKLETAINIGYSTRLLDRTMPLIIMKEEKICDLQQIIRNHSISLGERFGKPGNYVGLVINGTSLQRVLNSKYREDFVLLAMSCISVICCRCTPLQKAQVVEYVKKTSQQVTLAIGDGANDVAMIQKSTIGVGISGFEGLQATQNADYSIGQFKYLKKLLLVHGTWDYTRICFLIYLCYYKNFLLIVIQIYYAIFSGWSGQIIFDRWILIFYNVLFTSFPVLMLGVFEQRFTKPSLLKYPMLYLMNDWFNIKCFSLCMLNALWHGLLIVWLSLTILSSDVLWPKGYSDSVQVQGSTIYTVVILVICGKVALHMKHWTVFTALSILCSIFSWILVLCVISFIYPTLPIGENMRGMVLMMATSPTVLLTIFLVPIFVLSLDWFVITLWRTFVDPVAQAKAKYEKLSGNNEVRHVEDTRSPQRMLLRSYSEPAVSHSSSSAQTQSLQGSYRSCSKLTRPKEEVVFYFIENRDMDSEAIG